MGNGTDGKGLDRVFHIMTDAIISGVTIRNGYALNDYGAGIYSTSNLLAGTLKLMNVTITGNTSDVDGGGPSMTIRPPMCMCDWALSWCRNDESIGVSLSRWRGGTR